MTILGINKHVLYVNALTLYYEMRLEMRRKSMTFYTDASGAVSFLRGFGEDDPSPDDKT